jgi:hypothetical protein
MTGVIWKENNESWNISDVIGIYGTKFFGEIPDGLPKPVTVPNTSSVIDTIDIEANLNRVNRDGKISGTITFQGDWPGNTGVIGIGAFTDIPQQGNIFDYFFKNIALAYGIAINVQSTDYLLRVRSDNPIRYVAVLWINDSFDLTSIKDVGFYTDPQDAAKPGTVIVQKNSTQSGINITVDFSKF